MVIAIHKKMMKFALVSIFSVPALAMPCSDIKGWYKSKACCDNINADSCVRSIPDCSALSSSSASGSICMDGNDAVLYDQVNVDIAKNAMLTVKDLKLTGNLKSDTTIDVDSAVHITRDRKMTFTWNGYAQANLISGSDAPAIHTSQWSSYEGSQRWFSLRCDNTIWAESGIYVTSDRRIKKNIRPVHDGEALQAIRKLDAKVYQYKDFINKGGEENIGFIAQEVKEHIPRAAQTTASFIPNVMRVLDVQWQDTADGRWTMQLNETLESGKYRFYLNCGETDQHLTEADTADGRTFIVDEKCGTSVLVHGKHVDDLVTIDKNKIFAVAYAALQEVDRKQQVLEATIQKQQKLIDQLVARLDSEHR